MNIFWIKYVIRNIVSIFIFIKTSSLVNNNLKNISLTFLIRPNIYKLVKIGVLSTLHFIHLNYARFLV